MLNDFFVLLLQSKLLILIFMKIIFLDFDGVITTYESRWCIDIDKLLLLNDIVSQTDAKIVVSSSWKRGYDDVDDFKNSIYDKEDGKCSHLCYDSILTKEDVFVRFMNQIYDITDNKGSWRGDEIERWLDEHEEDVESYVILDDDSDFHEDQLFNFVQTDTYEGLTQREVKLCVARLNGKRIYNPIRMNLELTTMWRNKCHGFDNENNIDALLNEYYMSF